MTEVVVARVVPDAEAPASPRGLTTSLGRAGRPAIVARTRRCTGPVPSGRSGHAWPGARGMPGRALGGRAGGARCGPSGGEREVDGHGELAARRLAHRDSSPVRAHDRG